MAVMWLWRDTGDANRIASHMEATFWYVLPSLPMLLLVPALLRGGIPFWTALFFGCVVTSVLYLMTTWILARFGIQLWDVYRQLVRVEEARNATNALSVGKPDLSRAVCDPMVTKENTW